MMWPLPATVAVTVGSTCGSSSSFATLQGFPAWLLTLIMLLVFIAAGKCLSAVPACVPSTTAAFFTVGI
jgi:hypothetical protein